MTEVANGAGRHTAAAQSGNRRHPWIIPTADEALFDQLQKLALAHDRVAEAQSRKFDLLRVRFGGGKLLENPVVEGAMHLKFQRANRMRNPLDGIGQAMGIIIHRIDAPLAPGAMMV